MIQGPRGQGSTGGKHRTEGVLVRSTEPSLGSTGGKHRTEGVLVRGTEPSLGNIGRECRASGVLVATRKASATPESKSTAERSSEGVYISTIQLAIDRQA